MRLIDTDSHAVEAPDLWTSRMPSKWGNDIPHVKYVPEQASDIWFVGDEPIMPVGFTVIEAALDGTPIRNEENFPSFVTKIDDMHPSAFDPVERAKVMDRYGVDCAVLYPNLGFVGPDIYRVIENSSLEFQVGIAQAYNDWILDWQQQAPGRFISLACIPYWDIESAVAEIERCAELGHHGFVMTGVPDVHGEPMLADRHWDPMWAAAQATGLPISFHAGGGGAVARRMRVDEEGKVIRDEEVVTKRSVMGKNTSMVAGAAVGFMENGITIAGLLMSGILPRFPSLKFVSVESGVGWIPFVLETLDRHAERYDVKAEHPYFDEAPSFYFHRQVYANCWYEHLTDFHVETIGIDNLLFETDFPHPTCLIADEIGNAIETVTGALKPEDKEKILWKNAAQLFRVDV